MKDIVYALDAPPKDAINTRLEQEPITKKYWMNMGLSIIFLILATLLAGFSLAKKKDVPAPTFTIDRKNNTLQETVTLPYPHQSFKNISGWVFEAITASYSFDFNNYYSQLDKVSYYYTPEGYSMYLRALQTSKIESQVILNKIEISTVPLQEPVLIKGGAFGATEYWRYRVPVLISYYAGKTPIFERQLVELLVLRVPAYQNPKGLSIAEFNMVQL
jgi:intracellular multiplication protein IcmL